MIQHQNAWRHGVCVAALLGVSVVATPQSFAQTTETITTAEAPAEEAERRDAEIVVTGSLIRRDRAFSASPLTTVNQDAFKDVGANRIADLVQTLTINTGAENFSDAFNGQQTLGTENINLRGLGVQSTLVLLNGRRQVVTGTTNIDGISFVDIASLVPSIAVERLEIVTDGASALYGSDAVAGVANFITRDKFDGFEVAFEYRPQVDQGSQRDLSFQGLFGAQGERAGIIAAVSFLDRTNLSSAERPLFIPAFASSGFGNPGAFSLTLPVAAVDASGAPIQNPNGTFQVNTAAPVGFPPGLTDPGCAANGGITAGSGLGPCAFNFGPFFEFVPAEERLQGFSRFHYDVTDKVTARGEISYARNRVDSTGSPTNPFLALPFAVVPTTNPGAQATQFARLGGPNGGFTFANVPSIVTDPVTGAQSIQTGQPVTFIGRPIATLRPGGVPSEGSDFDFASDTFRANIGFEADYGGWNLTTDYTYAVNDFDLLVIDAIPQGFLNALNGFGGSDCPGPLGGVAPGTGPCLFFNPFASALNGALPNNPEVLDTILGFQTIDAVSELQVLDIIATTSELFRLPAGAVGFAFGFQFRAESLSQDFDAVTNSTGFAQRPQQDDFSGSRRVLAGFAEVSIPILENLELQAAGRIEAFSGGPGITANPKVALIYQPHRRLSLRGSYSTSFRAPSLFQTFGEQVSLAAITDPLFPNIGLNFVSLVASGGPDIQPETSRAFNIGFSVEPLSGLKLDFDFFQFDFDDVIIVESAQALVNAFPNSPDIERSVGPGGPGTGSILSVNVDFTNAASVTTSGIDFSARYAWESPIGLITPSFQGTYLLRYDLEDPFAGAINGVGSRNGANFGTATPQLRFNGGLGWELGPHSINTFVRYIGSLRNDEPVAATSAFAPIVNPPSPPQVTWDAQYNLNLSQLLGWEQRGVTLAFGGINLLSNEPPPINESIGFESRVFDPRGRILYFRTTFTF